MKKTSLTIFATVLILLMMTGPMGIVAQEEAVPKEVTSVNFLTPNTNPNREDWSILIENELPKAGIGVENEIVEWDTFGARTFAYEVKDKSEGVPLADDGGYDINFVGLSGSVGYDPTFSYSTEAVNPACCNFAFYNNTQVESMIKDYRTELDASKRADIASDIQAIIAEELPYIPIANTQGLWAFDGDTQFDGTDFNSDHLFMLATLNWGMDWSNVTHPTATDFVYGHTYDLTEYVPFVQQSYAAAAYMNPILPGLFERDVTDPDLNYAPALAAEVPEPEPGSNGRNFTVQIHPDAKFSNGDPVLAEDVVNTYRMHMAPAVGSTVAGGITPYLTTNQSVMALNDSFVKFSFEDPYFDAYGVMSTGIMDKSVIGTPQSPNATDYAFNEDPMTYAIGAGPYQYDQIEEAQSNVRLSAVSNWWGGDVGFDTLQFNKFSSDAIVSEAKAGNVHIVDNNANFERAEFEDTAGVKTAAIADFGTQFMTVNMKHPVFGTGTATPLGQDNPDRAAEAAMYMRQAISHMVPRDTIINEILNGRGAKGTSLWPNIDPAYDSSIEGHIDYDVQEARELVEKAGYTIEFPETEQGLLSAPGIVSVIVFSFFSSLVLNSMRKRD